MFFSGDPKPQPSSNPLDGPPPPPDLPTDAPLLSYRALLSVCGFRVSGLGVLGL